MALVKAICTGCGGELSVQDNASVLECRYCGTKFIVQEAINNYNTSINNTNYIQQANFSMVSTPDDLLINQWSIMIKRISVWCVIMQESFKMSFQGISELIICSS